MAVAERRSPIDIGATVAFFRPGIEALAGQLTEVLVGTDRDDHRRAVDSWVGLGVPAELATSVVGLSVVFFGLDIVEAQALQRSVVGEAAAVNFQLDDCLDLGWLRDRIIALPRSDRWQALARAAQRDVLYREHEAITAEGAPDGAAGHRPDPH